MSTHEAFEEAEADQCGHEMLTCGGDRDFNQK